MTFECKSLISPPREVYDRKGRIIVPGGNRSPSSREIYKFASSQDGKFDPLSGVDRSGESLAIPPLGSRILLGSIRQIYEDTACKIRERKPGALNSEVGLVFDPSSLGGQYFTPDELFYGPVTAMVVLWGRGDKDEFNKPSGRYITLRRDRSPVAKVELSRGSGIHNTATTTRVELLNDGGVDELFEKLICICSALQGPVLWEISRLRTVNLDYLNGHQLEPGSIPNVAANAERIRRLEGGCYLS